MANSQENAPLSGSSNTNGSSSTRHVRNSTSNNKKNSFQGKIDGMGGATLQLPSERSQGAPGQFSIFRKALQDYTGREIGEKGAKVWATAYIKQDNEEWEPPFPKKPANDNDPNYERDCIIYESKLEGYKRAIGDLWPAAKLEIWSTILAQCSPKLRERLERTDEFIDASINQNCIKLLQVVNVLSSGGKTTGIKLLQVVNVLSSRGKTTGFKPQAKADRLIDLIH